MSVLLRVRELTVDFISDGASLRAVDNVSFDIEAGETLGLVGESGSGKTVTALALLGLIGGPREHVSARSLSFEGRELRELAEPELRGLRGDRVAMIFQEPMTALNPGLTIGHQIAEVLRIHRHLHRAAARDRALELLQRVRLPDAALRLDDYPHQFSGGQRQRIMIAMALACEPALLIADEPSTALDATVQAQILDLLRDLKASSAMSVLLITHDLGVVAETCDRVAVIYAGRIVEIASLFDLFERPAHPYTRGLLAAAARGDTRRRLSRLADIPGQVPSLADLPPGCAFAPRCPIAIDRCRAARPDLQPIRAGQSAACLRALEAS